jgi:hypothetical protein
LQWYTLASELLGNKGRTTLLAALRCDGIDEA